jgi:hypothetical protein
MKQGDISESFGGTTSLTVTPITIAGALPSGWVSEDIGSVIQHGCAAQNGATWQLYSAGHLDSAVQTDTFPFAYKPLTGNGSITARMVSMNRPGTEYGFAGLMLRQTVGTTNTQYMFAGRRRTSR